MKAMRRVVLSCVVLFAFAGCAEGEADPTNPVFSGGGNSSSGDGDGDPSGDGDGDPTTSGDGDGDPSGDGDPTTGDGDGDPTTGDASCGNDTKEGGEECDGNDLGGLTCLDFGFQDGTLVCANDCTLFTNACSTCGDGQLSPTESCDGTNFGGLTCVDLGYGGGSLSCAADCKSVIETGCVAAASCGDGIINGNEQCDGANLGGKTCVSQGFDGGVLSCTPGCQLNTNNCTVNQCGNLFDTCNVLISNCCAGLQCLPVFGCAPN
jgi:hypothetical protein